MVTNFVLSVRVLRPRPDCPLRFVMVRLLTDRLLVRRTLSRVRFPHCAFSCRGESLAYCVARVLRDWGRPSVDGILLPHANAHHPTVSVTLAA